MYHVFTLFSNGPQDAVPAVVDIVLGSQPRRLPVAEASDSFSFSFAAFFRFFTLKLR